MVSGKEGRAGIRRRREGLHKAIAITVKINPAFNLNAGFINLR